LLCPWFSSYSCSFLCPWQFEQTPIRPMLILVVIIIVLFYFSCVEVECELAFYFKHKCFQKVMDYPPFERVVEVEDHPPLVKFFIYIFLWPCPFQEKIEFHPWNKFLWPLNIYNRKINFFMSPLHIYKETKH
jgi:hypothetical protein